MFDNVLQAVQSYIIILLFINWANEDIFFLKIGGGGDCESNHQILRFNN